MHLLNVQLKGPRERHNTSASWCPHPSPCPPTWRGHGRPQLCCTATGVTEPCFWVKSIPPAKAHWRAREGFSSARPCWCFADITSVATAMTALSPSRCYDLTPSAQRGKSCQVREGKPWFKQRLTVFYSISVQFLVSSWQELCTLVPFRRVGCLTP